MSRARAAGARAVRLGDGELLAAAELPAWVGAARSAGFGSVELETTAMPLARSGLAQQLRSLGVDGIAVPLFGADHDAHDWVVGLPGAMQRSLRGIRAAQAAGLRVRALLPILRPSYRGLDQLVAKLLPLGVPAFELRAVDALAPALWPNPALTAPFVRRAVALAVAARRTVHVHGLPACLLEEHGSRAVEATGPALELDARRSAGSFDKDSHDNATPACEICRWQAHCAQPSKASLEAFGVAALAARTDAPPRSASART